MFLFFYPPSIIQVVCVSVVSSHFCISWIPDFFNSFPLKEETLSLDSFKEVFRIKLVKSFKLVLKKSLYLLGIETIDEM